MRVCPADPGLKHLMDFFEILRVSNLSSFSLFNIACSVWVVNLVDVLVYTTHQTGSYPVFMPKQMPQSVRNYRSNRFNISSARTKVLTTSQVRFNSQKGGSRPHIRLHSNSPATSDTQLLAEGVNYLKSQRQHQQVGPSAHEL